MQHRRQDSLRALVCCSPERRFLGPQRWSWETTKQELCSLVQGQATTKTPKERWEGKWLLSFCSHLMFPTLSTWHSQRPRVRRIQPRVWRVSLESQGEPCTEHHKTSKAAECVEILKHFHARYLIASPLQSALHSWEDCSWPTSKSGWAVFKTVVTMRLPSVLSGRCEGSRSGIKAKIYGNNHNHVMGGIFLPYTS